jgi:hypothetical protein
MPGTKTSLATTTLAATHTAAAFKSGRNAGTLVVQAQQQAQELIVLLKEIIKDMQAGDPNIAAFQSLITALS